MIYRICFHTCDTICKWHFLDVSFETLAGALLELAVHHSPMTEYLIIGYGPLCEECVKYKFVTF